MNNSKVYNVDCQKLKRRSLIPPIIFMVFAIYVQIVAGSGVYVLPIIIGISVFELIKYMTLSNMHICISDDTISVSSPKKNFSYKFTEISMITYRLTGGIGYLEVSSVTHSDSVNITYLYEKDLLLKRLAEQCPEQYDYPNSYLDKVINHMWA